MEHSRSPCRDASCRMVSRTRLSKKIQVRLPAAGQFPIMVLAIFDRAVSGKDARLHFKEHGPCDGFCWCWQSWFWR